MPKKAAPRRKRKAPVDPVQAEIEQLRVNDPSTDPRFQKFAELYVTKHAGNGHQAALAAGYPPGFAKSHSWRLVKLLKLRMGDALRAQGLDEMEVVALIRRLATAKVPKWNRSKVVRPAKYDPKDRSKVLEPAVIGGWDYFDDSAAIGKAAEMLATLLDAKPATKVKGDNPDGSFTVRLISSVPRPARDHAPTRA